MILNRVTPMHHLTIVVSSAVPADAALAGDGRRDPEQRLRPERHVGLRVDELQAVLFSEVLEILDVEGG
jgi:hypothetical protein